MDPVHTFQPNFPKIHSNIVFPSKLRSSEPSLPLIYSDYNFACIYYLFHASYMSRPVHLPVPSPRLDLDVLFSTLFSNTLTLCSSLSERDHVSHPFKTFQHTHVEFPTTATVFVLGIGLNRYPCNMAFVTDLPK
jgi:hypothetical protein